MVLVAFPLLQTTLVCYFLSLFPPYLFFLFAAAYLPTLSGGDEDEYAEADLGKGVLTVLLNNGTCPKTGIHVLHKETVDQMFTNQISHLPPLSGTSISAAKAELTNPGEGLYPCTTPEDTQGWGLDFLLSGGARGRSMGSAQWSGLPNLRWWVDREKGVAGIIAMQVLPFGDLEAFILAEEVEGGVYEGLRMQT